MVCMCFSFLFILDLEVIFIIQNFNYVCAHTYMFSCAGTHNYYYKSVYTCVQADEAVHAVKQQYMYED